MHPSALKYGKLFFETYCKEKQDTTVVDIGAQNINGSLKDVCPKHLKYIGADFVEGRGVDVILDDPYKLPFEDNSIDIVVCSSVFEHSQFFWLLINEIFRVIKDDGIFYLNVPSNGYFHKFPVDCWRFYPDAGHALVAWLKRSGYKESVLLESFIGPQMDDVGDEGRWNDFVAVLGKNPNQSRTTRILDNITYSFNSYRSDVKELNIDNSHFLSQDFVNIDTLKTRLAEQDVQLAEISLRVDTLQHAFDALLSSLSWRLTAPFRCAAQALRFFKN